MILHVLSSEGLHTAPAYNLRLLVQRFAICVELTVHWVLEQKRIFERAVQFNCN
jgi:hypothetical protein